MTPEKMKELLSKKDRQLQSQKTDIGRLNRDREAHLQHITRLRRMLRNALDDAQGWREEASKEAKF